MAMIPVSQPRRILDQINNITVKCDNCHASMLFDQWNSHTKTACVRACRFDCGRVVPMADENHEKSCVSGMHHCAGQFYGCLFEGAHHSCSKHEAVECQFLQLERAWLNFSSIYTRLFRLSTNSLFATDRSVFKMPLQLLLKSLACCCFGNEVC